MELIETLFVAIVAGSGLFIGALAFGWLLARRTP